MHRVQEYKSYLYIYHPWLTLATVPDCGPFGHAVGRYERTNTNVCEGEECVHVYTRWSRES